MSKKTNAEIIEMFENNSFSGTLDLDIEAIRVADYAAIDKSETYYKIPLNRFSSKDRKRIMKFSEENYRTNNPEKFKIYIKNMYVKIHGCFEVYDRKRRDLGGTFHDRVLVLYQNDIPIGKICVEYKSIGMNYITLHKTTPELVKLPVLDEKEIIINSGNYMYAPSFLYLGKPIQKK